MYGNADVMRGGSWLGRGLVVVKPLLTISILMLRLLIPGVPEDDRQRLA